MEPFMRPTNPFGTAARPAPSGWEVRSVGLWRGRRVEIVFDPKEHDIALISDVAPAIAAALANAGWHRRGCDAKREWWVRQHAIERRVKRRAQSRGGIAL